MGHDLAVERVPAFLLEGMFELAQSLDQLAWWGAGELGF
jgi:hypothetical protein